MSDRVVLYTRISRKSSFFSFCGSFLVFYIATLMRRHHRAKGFCRARSALFLERRKQRQRARCLALLLRDGGRRSVRLVDAQNALSIIITHLRQRFPERKRKGLHVFFFFVFFFRRRKHHHHQQQKHRRNDRSTRRRRWRRCSWTALERVGYRVCGTTSATTPFPPPPPPVLVLDEGEEGNKIDIFENDENNNNNDNNNNTGSPLSRYRVACSTSSPTRAAFSNRGRAPLVSREVAESGHAAEEDVIGQ